MERAVLTSGTCAVDKSLPGLAAVARRWQGLEIHHDSPTARRWQLHIQFHIANGSLYLNEANGKGYTYSCTQTVLSA